MVLRAERGQAVVELALVLPVLVLLLLGLMEFGRVLHALLTVQHAAREGARLGITGATDAEIEARVRQAAGSLEGAGDPARLDVDVQPPVPQRTVGEHLRVKVRYKFRFAIPWFATLFPANCSDPSAPEGCRDPGDPDAYWFAVSLTMRI